MPRTNNKKASSLIDEPKQRATGERNTSSNEGDLENRIEHLLNQFEGELERGELKISVGDYLRLLQFRKEHKKDAPKDVIVQWVERLPENDAIGE